MLNTQFTQDRCELADYIPSPVSGCLVFAGQSEVLGNKSLVKLTEVIILPDIFLFLHTSSVIKYSH